MLSAIMLGVGVPVKSPRFQTKHSETLKVEDTKNKKLKNFRLDDKTWDHIHNTSFYLKLTNSPSKPVLQYTMLEWWLSSDNHSSLLGPFESYEENDVLRIGPL